MRILIVDDNEMVRRGVAALVTSRANWEVCGEAGNGTEALQKAIELSPDLILLDISMPGANGLEVARILRHELPDAKIVIMSQHDPIQLLPRAIAAGADACVDKGSLGTALLPTIEAVRGQTRAKVAGSVNQT